MAGVKRARPRAPVLHPEFLLCRACDTATGEIAASNVNAEKKKLFNHWG